MKILGIGLGICLAVLVGSSALVGCSSDPARAEEGELGNISLNLVGQTAGNTYRLRNGLFTVSGPTNTVLDSKVDPNANTLNAKLSSGSYLIDLAAGWSLERLDNGVFETVDATLISPNPKSFEIIAGENTNVAYQFSTNGTIVNIGVGDLTVSLSVVENGNGGGPDPEPSCANGIQDGLEEGVDCGGPECVPCGGGFACDPVNQVGCGGGEACYLISITDTACFPPGDLPINGPCDGSVVNECQPGAVCADIGNGQGQLCIELCDPGLNPPTCSTPGGCAEVAPGLGVCF